MSEGDIYPQSEIDALIKRGIKKADIGYILIDRNMRILFWNNWIEQASRQNSIEVFGKSLADVFPEIQDNRLGHAIYDAIDGKMPAILSSKLHRAPALTLWRADSDATPLINLLIIVRPVTGAQPERNGCFIQIIDETNSAKREMALRAQAITVRAHEEQLRTLFEAISDSVLLLDQEGNIVEANSTACRRLQTPQGVLQGTNLFGILPAFLSSVYREHFEALKQSRAVQRFEHTAGRYAYQASIFPVTNGAGDIRSVALLVSDITARKKMETDLSAALVAANAASRAKNDFLAHMSHELRTPLNAVIGFAQMLEYNPKEPLSAAQKKCVDHVLKGGQHLLHLISEILDLSKIEGGQIDLSIETIAVSNLLEECWSYIQPVAERCRVLVTKRPCRAITVKADYTRLKQVMLNLFSNAVKYNRPGGTVDVYCEDADGGAVAIVVADTGIGIPADRQGELFQPFCRLGQEGSAIEGTGIGLTITKRLVEMMGGSIGFVSAEGQGTTFRVLVPRAGPVSPVDGHAAALSLMEIDRVTATAVYIEDNPANIELMEMVFSHLDGAKLITAPSGELGIDLIYRARPDLVILDINLPGMDGFEILKKIRMLDTLVRIPVFALTASATKRDIERGYEAGFDRYLTKPFGIDSLIVAIRDIFDGHVGRGKVVCQDGG